MSLLFEKLVPASVIDFHTADQLFLYHLSVDEMARLDPVQYDEFLTRTMREMEEGVLGEAYRTSRVIVVSPFDDPQR